MGQGAPPFLQTLEALKLHIDGDDDNAGIVLQETSVGTFAKFMIPIAGNLQKTQDACASMNKALEAAFLGVYTMCYYDKDNKKCVLCGGNVDLNSCKLARYSTFDNGTCKVSGWGSATTDK